MPLTFKNLIFLFDTYFIDNNTYFSVIRINNTHLILGGDTRFKEFHTNFLKKEGNPACMYHLET